LINQLSQSQNQTLEPWVAELPERPDELKDIPIHKDPLKTGTSPLDLRIVAGSEADLIGAYPKPVKPTGSEAIGPFFGSTDFYGIANGIAQFRANQTAQAEYRTDAARAEASRLEGDLRQIEERIRKRIEQYERMKAQQINQALIDLEKKRILAMQRDMANKQQAIIHHQQQFAIPRPQPTHGHRSGGPIRDH
jgi:hypothetical protein